MTSVNILADVFTSAECQNILKNKYVLLIGDSVIRGMYKDLVKFLQKDDHLYDYQLKSKGEFNFENDILLEGGQKGVLSNDVTYSEVREYKTPFNYIRFYFITRCFSEYMKSICEDIKNESEKPDLVLMNSGCWDLTRYGQNSLYEYKKNLPEGIYNLIKVLPFYTLFIWTTTLPLSKDVKGGFMVPEAECHQSKLREDVLEANNYAVNVMDEFRLDLLDLHFYFQNQIQRRAKDGIHWDATAHRRITNLILNHVCDAWDLETPGRILMKKEVLNTQKEIQNMEIIDLEKLDNNIYTNFEKRNSPQSRKSHRIYSNKNDNFSEKTNIALANDNLAKKAKMSPFDDDLREQNQFNSNTPVSPENMNRNMTNNRKKRNRKRIKSQNKSSNEVLNNQIQRTVYQPGLLPLFNSGMSNGNLMNGNFSNQIGSYDQNDILGQLNFGNFNNSTGFSNFNGFYNNSLNLQPDLMPNNSANFINPSFNQGFNGFHFNGSNDNETGLNNLLNLISNQLGRTHPIETKTPSLMSLFQLNNNDNVNDNWNDNNIMNSRGLRNKTQRQ